MPTKNFLSPYKLVNAGDMSGNVTSSAVDIRYLDNIAVQLNATGSPTGTFSVEGSVDSSNWTALTLSSTPSVSGAGSTQILDLNQVPFPYVRVKYTAASGSGSLDVWVSGKAI